VRNSTPLSRDSDRMRPGWLVTSPCLTISTACTTGGAVPVDGGYNEV
jgi:hypothetical protein